MNKLISLSALVFLMAIGSIEAGQKLAIQPPVPQLDRDIIIEDEATGDFLVIDPNSGVYKFYRCTDGFSMSGTGLVSFFGCAMSFQDLQTDHRVLASIDLCTQQAKAIVEQLVTFTRADTEPVKVTLNDKNIGDNTASCLQNK